MKFLKIDTTSNCAWTTKRNSICFGGHFLENVDICGHFDMSTEKKRVSSFVCAQI